MKLLRAFRYVRGVSRGVRRGDTFPPAGRVPARPAPGGSTSTRVGRGVNELDVIELTEHVVPVPGLAREVRVLQLSDVHLRGHDARAARLGEVVAGQRPDLVALTGDIVTRGYTTEAVDRLLAALPDAPLGKWSVMGNWEYWGGAPRDVWEGLVTRHGITLLHDRSVDVGPLQLVGTDDALAGDPDVDAAFADVRPGKPALVLTHSPGIFPKVARSPARVVLAGHTHGGQVRIPLLGPFFLPRGSGPYPWGWYEHDGVWMFVSRGVGWSVAPLRWRAPPEVATIRLVPG
ncbi:MAG: metallophosphoesterase [Myxococcota bacterium]